MAVFEVRVVIFRVEVDLMRKELDDVEFGKLLPCLVHPVAPFENHIAINPCDVIFGGRYRFQGEVEKPFFLPERGTAGDLHQNIRIAFLEFKPTIKGKFDGDERNTEVGAENSVVWQASPEPCRIEVRGYGPHYTELLCRIRRPPLFTTGQAGRILHSPGPILSGRLGFVQPDAAAGLACKRFSASICARWSAPFGEQCELRRIVPRRFDDELRFLNSGAQPKWEDVDQSGPRDFRFWHFPDMPRWQLQVRLRSKSGHAPRRRLPPARSRLGIHSDCRPVSTPMRLLHNQPSFSIEIIMLFQ